MVDIDPAYIQAIEHRPKPTIAEENEIPTIDLSSIASINHLSEKDINTNNIANLVVEIGNACEKWGFFQVINHGVSKKKLEDMELVGRAFFSLPSEEKRKVSRDEVNPMGYYDSEHSNNVRDWKQVYDFTVNDPTFVPTSPDNLQPKKLFNPWPQSPPEFREVAQEYAKEIEKLAFKVLELIALGLGLEAQRLNGFFEDHASFTRLSHYPPCPCPDLVLGITRHKDGSALTIVAQDDVGGLQVRRKSDGEWININPIPGAFVINLGDVIQVWSNDKYESPEHRAIVNTGKDRLSIPFFFNPAHTVMVKPLEEMADDQMNPPKYREYNWGVFFASKRNSNFRKLQVENIQISHFRITE